MAEVNRGGRWTVCCTIKTDFSWPGESLRCSVIFVKHSIAFTPSPSPAFYSNGLFFLWVSVLLHFTTEWAKQWFTFLLPHGSNWFPCLYRSKKIAWILPVNEKRDWSRRFTQCMVLFSVIKPTVRIISSSFLPFWICMKIVHFSDNLNQFCLY
jgi:hypothetical protein